jgi:PKD repeat protein
MKHFALLCVCLCLAALTPAVSAGNITPSAYGTDFFVSGNLSGYNPTSAIDGNINTSWIPATRSGWWNYTNPYGMNITKVWYYTDGDRGFKCNDGDYHATGAGWNLVTDFTPTTSFVRCNGNGAIYPNVFEVMYSDGTPETITADFTATPTTGQAPLYVAFDDNSTGGSFPKTYNWSVSPDTGVIGEESTSEYPTFAFTQNGNFSITHCVSDGTRSDCETKTDYISVYNSTATTTTYFWAVDPLGHRVWDSAISLQDVQNSTWTNTSSPSGGVATITSLFGHTINGYATAAGYNDGETTGIPADGVSGGIILMTPTNITNVSTGYVTLYVYVKEATGNAPIPGVYVNLAYAEGGSTHNDGGTTSSEGLTSFVVPKETLIYVYGEKVGYEKVSTTKDSGSASGGDASVSVILYMGSQTVTPTVTATTGPGGTVPVTVDPRTPQEKESDIALILIDYGDMLVMFFIALTVIGGVKMIMK